MTKVGTASGKSVEHDATICFVYRRMVFDYSQAPMLPNGAIEKYGITSELCANSRCLPVWPRFVSMLQRCR
jgi:hypothetical protein